MPTYKLSCKQCPREYEVDRSITHDLTLEKCSKCKGEVQQVIESVWHGNDGVLLKGSDWPGKFNRSKKDKWYT